VTKACSRNKAVYVALALNGEKLDPSGLVVGQSGPLHPCFPLSILLSRMAPMKTRMLSVIRITPIALLLLSGAEATILTLPCDGTMTNLTWTSDHKPEPVTNMGLVVNLSEGTVTGFAFPAGIYKTDATRVEFKGESGNWSVWGTIDRITSTVKATTTVLYPISVHSWDLICKPRPF
jgi:hypothetical protein